MNKIKVKSILKISLLVLLSTGLVCGTIWGTFNISNAAGRSFLYYSTNSYLESRYGKNISYHIESAEFKYGYGCTACMPALTSGDSNKVYYYDDQYDFPFYVNRGALDYHDNYLSQFRGHAYLNFCLKSIDLGDCSIVSYQCSITQAIYYAHKDYSEEVVFLKTVSSNEEMTEYIKKIKEGQGSNKTVLAIYPITIEGTAEKAVSICYEVIKKGLLNDLDFVCIRDITINNNKYTGGGFYKENGIPTREEFCEKLGLTEYM